MEVLQQIWLYEIIGGMLLMCQNTTMRVYGAWIKTYHVLCPKTYSSFGNVSKSTASSRQAARGACICETGLLRTQSLSWDIAMGTTLMKWADAEESRQQHPVTMWTQAHPASEAYLSYCRRVSSQKHESSPSARATTNGECPDLL